MSTQTAKRIVSALLMGSLLMIFMAGILSRHAISADPMNPRAEFWRVVREGIPGFMKAPAEGHPVLIQNAGENWREIRNGFLMRMAQGLIALALIGMALFYRFVGPDKLEKPRSGTKIERFSRRERILHWSTALLFIIMAVTGLSLLLGRLTLIPVFGHPIVSGYLLAAKGLHNYCGPLLLVGIILEFINWVRINVPNQIDLQWFKGMGGMIGGHPRPHAEMFNGGEKAWFWGVFVFGAAVGITGIILDFPIWGQSRLAMQVSHVIHAAVAVIFVTVSFGHIYMGTLGVEGAFEGMWTGSVDAVWAGQHHDLWYEEKMHEQQKKPEIP
jgi:formate dehydrogenase subunit gamma